MSNHDFTSLKIASLKVQLGDIHAMWQKTVKQSELYTTPSVHPFLLSSVSWSSNTGPFTADVLFACDQLGCNTRVFVRKHTEGAPFCIAHDRVLQRSPNSPISLATCWVINAAGIHPPTKATEDET